MPLLLMLLFQQAVSAPPEAASSSSTISWSNFRAAVNQQSLQTVLISIEERLRALDTIYSPRYTPRWEISIEQQSRRMETIESRLGRLETLLELRLDKISEMMSAKQLKEELAKDQINRKIDSTYERVNHRLGYLEARLDVGISKLQSTIEAGVGRMERLETTAMTRQSELGTELAGISTGIDDVKKQLSAFEDRYNNSLLTMVEHGKHMVSEMNGLTTRVENLHVGLNKTQASSEQSDEEGTSIGKNINIMLEKITGGIDRHANNFITKANNMYNDMWRRTQVLEGLTKDTMSLSNATRRELQEGIRTIAVQLGRRGLLQSERERQEDSLGVIQRRLNEMGRKFDSSFQMLLLAQNLFLESCHRIQLDEPQLEAKLTRVLERIVDTITNRSITTDREMRQMQDLLKSHNAHMTRTIGHTTNTMLQSSEQSRQLQVEVLSAKEQILESNKYIEDAISDIREERLAATERLDNIVSTIQELQTSVTDITLAKQEGEKFRYEMECPDSDQIAIEIIAEIQRQRGQSHENCKELNHVFDINSVGNNLVTSNPSEEEESIMEGNRNSSSGVNMTEFQLQHRFDMQAYRNDSAQKSSEVTIEIIPGEARTTDSGEIEEHFPGSSINESDNSLFGIDFNNVAAIIQDTNSTSNRTGKTTILKIVHTIQANDGIHSVQPGTNGTIPHNNTTPEEKSNFSNRENPNAYNFSQVLSLPIAMNTSQNHDISQEKSTIQEEFSSSSTFHESLLDIYGQDRLNETDADIWRSLISKFKQGQTTSEESDQNSTTAETSSIGHSETLHKLMSSVNDHEDNEQLQYLARLQELATELENRSSNMTTEEVEQMLER